jgi:Flp pilus assembly protein TadD
MKKNQPAIALPYLERAARGQAENPVFLYHLGVAYEALAEMAKARDALTRALALKGNFPGADEARTLLKSIPK